MNTINYPESEGNERRRTQDRETEREIRDLRERVLVLEKEVEDINIRIESNTKAIKERKPFKELAGDFLYKVICGAFIMAAITAATKFFSGVIEKLTK